MDNIFTIGKVDPYLPGLNGVLRHGGPVLAVHQLAQVSGQDSPEGGQVDLGPAVAVVVRSQSTKIVEDYIYESVMDDHEGNDNIYLAGKDLKMLCMW